MSPRLEGFRLRGLWTWRIPWCGSRNAGDIISLGLLGKAKERWRSRVGCREGSLGISVLTDDMDKQLSIWPCASTTFTTSVTFFFSSNRHRSGVTCRFFGCVSGDGVDPWRRSGYGCSFTVWWGSTSCLWKHSDGYYSVSTRHSGFPEVRSCFP